MDNRERRQIILKKLRTAGRPVTGRELAAFCGVSRQIVVGDIAMLRASGEKIIATPQGYLSGEEPGKELRKLSLRCASEDELREELEIIVDNGGAVRGAAVDYGAYGQIAAKSDICSRRDIRRWEEDLRAAEAGPFSLLAGGRHVLFVEMENEEAAEEIVRLLREARFLQEE